MKETLGHSHLIPDLSASFGLFGVILSALAVAVIFFFLLSNPPFLDGEVEESSPQNYPVPSIQDISQAGWEKKQVLL